MKRNNQKKKKIKKKEITNSKESESEFAQSCPTLCNPMDCSLPGSSIHGIFQARILEWGAIWIYINHNCVNNYIIHYGLSTPIEFIRIGKEMNTIQLSVIYKCFPLNIKTQRSWKQMDGKGVCHAYSMPKKVGVTMLTSDDLIFKRKVFPEVNREILIGSR